MSMNFLLIYFLSLFLFVRGQNTTNSSKLLFPSDCGTTRFDNASKRIITGDQVGFPYPPSFMARLGILRNNRTTFFCGGSLVSSLLVITAAHCNQANGNIVRLGENYLNTLKDCNENCAPPPQDIKIKKFVSHQKYCFHAPANDIAMVELSQPAQFNEFVQPICLPSNPIPYEDLMKEPLTIIGWGLMKSGPPRFKKSLRHIEVPVLVKEECNEISRKVLEASQICIGYWKGEDLCYGNSGGPVIKTMVKNGVKRAYLVGVASHGLVNCGNGPEVFTGVSYFLGLFWEYLASLAN